MRRWKLSFLAGLGYSSMDASSVIESLRGLGYEGIEWTTAHFDPDLPLGRLRELVERTRDAGMEVSRIMAHEDLVSLDDRTRRRRIERTVRAIEAAGECGVATVGTMTGPAAWDAAAPRVGEDISESAAWEQVLEAYDAFIKAAEKSQVVISSEAVFGQVAHDFYSHRYLMAKAASPFHRVNFDPSHGILYGNLDVSWVIGEWGQQIAHVHLKDAVGEPVVGRFVFPLLGEGRVDWRSLFRALDATGYTGFCSVEFESFEYYKRILHEDPEAAARISIRQVESLLDD
ncbi:MAG: sugar phosphate isomerase/epimerase [Chloroflexi bacterium]|nr:sugar phosphate isomerase/epimerase [Chloroflexota bacterium]